MKMFRFLAKSAAVMAAVVLFAGTAKADFVEFTVVGSFTVPGVPLAGQTYSVSSTATDSTITVTETATGAKSTLTYNFNNLDTGLALHHFEFVPAETSASFGYFTTAVTAGTNPPNLQNFLGVGFSLTVTQVAPPGSGGSPATLTGFVQESPNGSSVQVVFTSPSFAIPSPNGNLYVLDPIQSIHLTPSKIEGQIFETTTPTTGDAPLPAIAPAALLLLGGFGLKRKRASVVA